MKTKLVIVLFASLFWSCAIVDVSNGYISNLYPTKENRMNWMGIDLRLKPTASHGFFMPFLFYSETAAPFQVELILQDTNRLPIYDKIKILNIGLFDKRGKHIYAGELRNNDYEIIHKNVQGGSWFRETLSEKINPDEKEIKAYYSVLLIDNKNDTINMQDTLNLKKKRFNEFNTIKP